LAGVSQPLAVSRVEREPRHELDLLVLDATKILAWERLLFVGCGDGWIAEEAWRRALRAYALGLDTSPELVAQAGELRGVPGNLEFRPWDGRLLPCADASFHRVITTFALRQAEDPVAALGKMHRVLEPAGHLYLFEIDRRSYAPAGTVPAFRAALHRAGFRDAKEVCRREVTLDDGEPASAAIVHARA